jgi:hypothetical protein
LVVHHNIAIIGLATYEGGQPARESANRPP